MKRESDTEIGTETQNEENRLRKCVIDCQWFTMILPSQQVCMYTCMWVYMCIFVLVCVQPQIFAPYKGRCPIQ